MQEENKENKKVVIDNSITPTPPKKTTTQKKTLTKSVRTDASLTRSTRLDCLQQVVDIGWLMVLALEHCHIMLDVDGLQIFKAYYSLCFF